MKDLKRTASAAGVAIAFGLLSAAAALADPYGTGRDGVGLMPFHLKLAWCHYNGNGSSADEVMFRSRTRQAMEYLASATQYRHVKTSGCSSDTDLVFSTIDMEPGTRGKWECKETYPISSGRVCRRALIRLSTRELNDSNNYLKTACHEVGHAVGLSHNPPYDTDCMISGWVGRRYTTYSTHHLSHLRSGRISQ